VNFPEQVISIVVCVAVGVSFGVLEDVAEFEREVDPACTGEGRERPRRGA
jgi:hypothetical protein